MLWLVDRAMMPALAAAPGSSDAAVSDACHDDTGVALPAARTLCNTLKPSLPGSIRSSTIRS